MKKAVRNIKQIGAGLFLLLAACAPEHEPARTEAPPGVQDRTEVRTVSAGGAGRYAFEAPERSLPLDDALVEISGLTTLGDGRLAAVQDEAGILFILNPETGAVAERRPFAQAGDYEGIERAGDRLFVLRSNGTLIEMTGWQEGSPQVREIETALSSKNDTEGLTYDAANERLLIAAKEDPGKGLKKDQKAIYAFDLSTNTLSAEPVFTIDLDALKGQLKGARRFKPSALAVHPTDGDVYVLSSVAKAVVVLDAGGKTKHVWDLPGALYEQPEGLAFLPDGDLVISSEGVDRPAMLHRIAPQGGS